MKNILDDDERTVFSTILRRLFYRVALKTFQGRSPYFDTELFVAIRTFEYQRLTFIIFLFIECDVLVAFRAFDTFHTIINRKDYSTFMIHDWLKVEMDWNFLSVS